MHCVSVCGHRYLFAIASSCCPHTNFPSPKDTPVQKFEVQELASGAIILFSLFALVSTPLQAEKHLSSNSLQTTTVLNLIKDIPDNRRAIKQQSFQCATRAYIPVAQRVTALSFTSQRFFKVISLLCVLPPPPLPVNPMMQVVWNNSFN